MSDEKVLRKTVLNGKKSERIIFAVTPEMKETVAQIAEEKCVSVSAYITQVLAADIIANMDLLKGVAKDGEA